ncbi:hypothetical protein R3W88_021845 [Solanum pinnatisectum]|uniref:Uncharacterized protein n=1 Tax=Solanum pinnatisectum TaxID=50273 RepID=A0AAV9LSY6_9SOLN|nr:hypothetical protein R3W88_021845 [Solanum pinnatisectum]
MIRCIWVRDFADGEKLTEVRIGRGEGNPMDWIVRMSRGQILFEMDDMSLSNVRQAATLTAHKLRETQLQSQNTNTDHEAHSL